MFFMPRGLNRKSSYHNNRLEAKFESCLRLIYSTHFTHVVQRPPQSQSDQTKQLLEKGGKKKQGGQAGAGTAHRRDLTSVYHLNCQ